MKDLAAYFTLCALLYACACSAQDERPGLGFYFQPEYSAMLLEGHVGNAVGFGAGVVTRDRRWNFGLRYYGRSGPINLSPDYDLVLSPGVTYRGKSTLRLGADHGYIGVEAGYNLSYADGRLVLRFPVSLAQVGAGFYLKGDDRITPDGRRVSAWEDELQDGTDAGFGFASELGAQVAYRPFPAVEHLSVVAGAHFTKTYGFTSFLGGHDFYDNKLRLAVALAVGF